MHRCPMHRFDMIWAILAAVLAACVIIALDL
jgi:hypothetical protein